MLYRQVKWVHFKIKLYTVKNKHTIYIIQLLINKEVDGVHGNNDDHDADGDGAYDDHVLP